MLIVIVVGFTQAKAWKITLSLYTTIAITTIAIAITVTTSTTAAAAAATTFESTMLKIREILPIYLLKSFETLRRNVGNVHDYLRGGEKTILSACVSSGRAQRSLRPTPLLS